MLLRYQLPAFVWALVVLGLTLTPGEHLPSMQWGTIMVDKAMHFGAFGLLGFLSLLGARTRKSQRIILVLGPTYGMLLEFLQYFVPGRQIDFYDLTANICGFLAGAWLYKGYQKVAGSLAKK